jgi:hypothetical protein
MYLIRGIIGPDILINVHRPSYNMSVMVIGFQPFNAGINSFRATMSTEIFLQEILIIKGLAARRLYKSFDVKGLI